MVISYIKMVAFLLALQVFTLQEIVLTVLTVFLLVYLALPRTYVLLAFLDIFQTLQHHHAFLPVLQVLMLFKHLTEICNVQLVLLVALNVSMEQLVNHAIFHLQDLTFKELSANLYVLKDTIQFHPISHAKPVLNGVYLVLATQIAHNAQVHIF